MSLLKRKSVLVLMLIVGVAWIVYSISSFVDLARRTHTRAIDQELKAALDASQALPPGIGRAEDLALRLKQIKPGYAPGEVKEALADYINALEADINAFKAGENITRYDQEMERTQKKLAAAVAKHWN